MLDTVFSCECCKYCYFVDMLCYTRHLLQICPSWGRNPSLAVSVFIPLLKGFLWLVFFCCSSQGWRAEIVTHRLALWGNLWIWAIQIQFDNIFLYISSSEVKQIETISLPYFLVAPFQELFLFLILSLKKDGLILWPLSQIGLNRTEASLMFAWDETIVVFKVMSPVTNRYKWCTVQATTCVLL